MAIDYRMIVGTKIDGTDIQQQIDKLPVKKIVVQPTVKGSKEIKTMTDDMGSLVTTTTKFNKVGESTGTTLSKVSTNFKDTSNQIKTASTHTTTLAGKFVDITKKVVAFGAVTSLIGAFTKSMYEAVESVKVMDESLTELKKVTDLSGDGLENYTDQAFAMARDLKTTASDVTDAVTEFAKSNYTLEESQVLAKQALIFQTIADGAISASDSATMLIQVMKAYGMTVSDSVKIVDSINEVDILAFLFGNI